VDGDEGMSRGTQGDGVNKAAALEQGALTVNAACIVFAALPYVDDAAFCCASESGFEFVEFPFEAFHCRHPGGMLCSICGIWRSPNSLESSALKAD